MDDVSHSFFSRASPASRTPFRLRLLGIPQQRLQLPFPLCYEKCNNLVRWKRGEKKKPLLISRKFCWLFSLQDFNCNPAVNCQLICFIFSLALCSNWKAACVHLPLTKHSLCSPVAAGEPDSQHEEGISPKPDPDFR